ncbi:MAG: hypothetical protein WBS20_04185, partial [Lysobacterales bacterium]
WKTVNGVGAVPRTAPFFISDQPIFHPQQRQFEPWVPLAALWRVNFDDTCIGNCADASVD